MKKYIITSAMIFVAVTTAAAEEGRTQPVKIMKAMPAVMRVASSTPGQMPMQELTPATITTGDAVTDAKIKALQVEMEAKIKAIRDDYQAKIKVLIGNKKVNSGNDMMNRGSSTLRMGKGEGRDDHEGMRGSSTMMRDGSTMYGSGTPSRPPMMREGKQIPAGMQVRGESTGAEANEGIAPAAGVKGFFNRLFGR